MAGLTGSRQLPDLMCKELQSAFGVGDWVSFGTPDVINKFLNSNMLQH